MPGPALPAGAVCSVAVMLPLLLAAVSPAFAAPPPALPVALELARRGLAGGEEAAASDAIEAAVRAAGTSGLLVPAKELARLRYYEGVVAWRGGLQAQAMVAWRRLWSIGGWDPADDGLLDDEGMAVLRALRSEGGADTVPVRISGETRGVLLLGDGTRLEPNGALSTGPHLVQVRCADGAVSSRWLEVEAGATVSTGCRRGPGGEGVGGVNESVLAEGVDPDLLQMALFGSYFADSALRLSGLPEASPPRPAPPAPAAFRAEAEPPPMDAGAFSCEGEPPVYAGRVGDAAWSGPLRTDEGRVLAPGTAWLESSPGGDARLLVEGEGDFGVRVFATADQERGVAVRLLPGRLMMRQLPDGPPMGRDVPTAGRHVLQVDTVGSAVRVRLDGALLIGMTSGVEGVSLAVEGAAGAWLGEVAVCRR